MLRLVVTATRLVELVSGRQVVNQALGLVLPVLPGLQTGSLVRPKERQCHRLDRETSENHLVYPRLPWSCRCFQGANPWTLAAPLGQILATDFYLLAVRKLRLM